MAQTIGELFVKLGFDVDDGKLRQFQNGVDDTFRGLLKFAGVLTGAAGITWGLREMGHTATQTAVSLRDLRTEFGISEEQAGRFAAQWKNVNPTQSLEQGYGVMAALAQYRVQMLQGGGQEFGFFGGSLAQTTPEQMMQQLRRGYGLALAQAHGNTAMVTKWIQDITGSPGAVNWIRAQQSQLDNAAKLWQIQEKQNQTVVNAAAAVSNLGTAWQNFYTKIIADIAPQFTNQMNTITNKGWSHFFDGWGGPGSIVGDFINRENAQGKAASGKNSPVINQLMGFGWSREQAEGIFRRLTMESNLNPAAVGDSGLAYGIAQWHPDRQAAFAAWAGHPIQGSSLSEQLKFLNYEMTKGSEKRAGSILRKMQNPQAAYDAFTRYYERPASVTNNVNINVQTTADAHETAEITKQKMLEVTYSQLNPGAAW